MTNQAVSLPYADEREYKLMNVHLTFEAPADLHPETAREGVGFWLQRFDKHGALGMDCVAYDVTNAKPHSLLRSENDLLAALLARGYNASKVDLPHSTYDIIVEKSKHDLIRVQVKTVGSSGGVSFVGGVRGGADRKYKSSVKEYVQNTETSDVVVGVQSTQNNGDIEINFYFIPTLYIETLGQKSLSINRIPHAKNNWALLENCKDMAFVKNAFGF